MYGVTIAELIEKMDFKNLTPELDSEKIIVSHPDVNRPALQLTGFYAHFDNERVQMIGNVEIAYLSGLSRDRRIAMYDKLISSKIPCLVFCRNQVPEPEVTELCNHYGVPCLLSAKPTSDTMAEVIRWLKAKLAPCISIHGVLVDVFGEGVLITGESGIGKSEAALELIKRGHRLVSDDVVEIRKVSDETLVGSAPDITRYLIEVRGIGIIDVKEIFGIGAVKDTENIDMIIHLEPWEEGKQYDRLGMVDEYTNIMGINVPSLTIPVKLGRNLAVIVEVASMNNRQKRMGYNAAVELNNRLMSQMESQLGNL